MRDVDEMTVELCDNGEIVGSAICAFEDIRDVFSCGVDGGIWFYATIGRWSATIIIGINGWNQLLDGCAEREKGQIAYFGNDFMDCYFDSGIEDSGRIWMGPSGDGPSLSFSKAQVRWMRTFIHECSQLREQIRDEELAETRGSC